MTLQIDTDRNTDEIDLGSLGTVVRQDVSELPEFRAALMTTLEDVSVLTLVDPQVRAGVRLKFDGGLQVVIANVADELYVGGETPKMGPFGIVENRLEELPEGDGDGGPIPRSG